MTEVEIHDVIAMVLPPEIDPADPKLLDKATLMARKAVWEQYSHPSLAPDNIRFDPIEWLLTRDADEADAFQPAHDCAACLAGTDQMQAFLREHPDRWVVVGNIRYVEVWPT